MTRKIYKIEGLVIDKRDRGEKDIIFTILTPDEGKMDVLAKHAKKVPSRHNSGLELFNGVQCQLYEGRFLPVVTQSRQLYAFPFFIGNYERLMTAYKIIGLLKSMVAPEQSILPLYDFVLKTLHLLNNDKTDIAVLFSIFQIKLLRMLGFFHVSPVCEQCGCHLKKTVHYFQNRYLCSSCARQEELHFSQRVNEILQDCCTEKMETLLNRNYQNKTLLESINVCTFFTDRISKQYIK